MFVVFQQEAVDLAIIEVRIGGLLDNTNVGPSTRQCDYDDWFGPSRLTRRYVGRNYGAKAGIIKAGQKVVVGPVTRECMDVIRSTASEQGATVQAFGRISH